MRRALASAGALACISAAHGNPVGDQLAALPETQRRIFFTRLLQREGERCPAITRTFFQGSMGDGSVVWSVTCDGGKDWLVSIANTPGGEGRYLDCAILKLMNGPFCFTKLKR